MIDLFRKFTPANLFFLTGIGFILCLAALLKLPEYYHPTLFEPAITDFVGILTHVQLTPLTNVLITLAITIIQALLLNAVVNKYNILGNSTFLPALMYVTNASLLLPFLALTPTLICNFLLIWMLDKALNIYHSGSALAAIFDMGMIVAVGSLIYFPFLAMFPSLWIALILFRPFNWREWVASIIGFLTIYFLLGIIYFWHDKMADFYTIWSPLKQPFPIELKFNIDHYDYLVLIPLVLILLLFLNSLRENFFKSIVHVRKAFQLLFFMLLLSILSIALKDDYPDYHFILSLIPISIYMAYYFDHAKIKWLYESMYLLLLISILYFQFF
ncbi:DUF6427 family protein [Olivibacter sitiensis]|uniref:DUF6427 family protein n=1 Tax=Olivibacter sitiensis TaxID=376470 RepID=UPI0004242378|nr:DUF6427 family protein [Olivibacter sitiensis]